MAISEIVGHDAGAQLEEISKVKLKEEKTRPYVYSGLCRRCPPALGYSGIGAKGLCKLCTHYYYIKRKESTQSMNPVPLSVEEFLLLYPSSYLAPNKGLCQRCLPARERAATSRKSVLCEFCQNSYYTKRNKLRKDYPDRPLLTVEKFIELYPTVANRRAKRMLCIRCPASLKRMAVNVRLGLCETCRTYWWEWRTREKKADRPEAELTIGNFVRKCPSIHFRKREMCQRCPSELKKVAQTSKRPLCKSCEHLYYLFRRSQQEKFPDDPPVTLDDFLKKYAVKPS